MRIILAAALAAMSSYACAVDRTFQVNWVADANTENVTLIWYKGLQPEHSESVAATAGSAQRVIDVDNGDIIKCRVTPTNAAGDGPLTEFTVTVSGIPEPPGAIVSGSLEMLPQ